jgi:MFS family permease
MKSLLRARTPTGALLLTLGIGVFAGAFDLGVISPALPAIAEFFHVTPRDASLLISIYLLANIASIPVATKLADRYGRRPVYIACVALFAAGSVLSIVAPTWIALLIGRTVQAAGAGGIFPVATAAIADRVPAERRGGALGALGAIWGLAGILGPIAGGALTHWISWRAIFVFNVPLAVLVILMAQIHLPSLAPGKRGPLDFAGIGLLTIGLIGVIVGLSRFDPQMPALGNQSSTIVALLIALAAFIGLHFVERKATDPVISPALTKNRQIAITYGLELLIGALEGGLFFVPAAVMAGQHLSAGLAGLIAGIGAICFVAVIPATGRALDRVGARTVLLAGTLVTSGGLALFAFCYRSLGLSILAMILSGIGFGALLGAPTRYIISNEAPAANRSSAIGLLSIFLIIGQVVGSSLAGGCIGGSEVSTAQYQLAYLAFAAVGLLAFAVTLTLAPHRKASTIG